MPTALSPLMDALYHGRIDEVQRLLSSELASDSLTIHEAAAVGSLARLEQLLTADPAAANSWSTDGFQPLGLAAFFGHRQAVELLLARGAEVSTPARHQFHVTALHAALAGPDPGIARLLLSAGADPNASQQYGLRPLHTTAQNGDLEHTRLLLEHGADPEAPDEKGRTPADLAREHGRTAVLTLLETR